MSCSLNRVNRESYEIPANLAAPDQNIDRVYNPNTQIPHPPPWPLERTQFDMNLQKIWCPGCAENSFYGPKQPVITPQPISPQPIISPQPFYPNGPSY